MKIKLGLIGYGKVAGLHARALQETPNAVLAAVAGRNDQRRDAFAREWGVSSRKTVEEMVEKDGVDAVIITTPHPQHHGDCLRALAAGAHVLVEKPMAVSPAEGREMIEAAKGARKILSVVSQRRWFPASRRIRAAIDEGKIGTPALAQAVILGWRDQAYYESDPWRGRWDTEGGGVCINQAPHQFDLMSWFMGPLEEVQGFWANINHPYIEVEDSAVASLRFKNGGLGSLLVSNSQNPGIHAKVHIHGSSGHSVGVQTDGGAMFIAGSTGMGEPPYNDLWTIPGEKEALETWREEDARFFSTIEPTWYFMKCQIEDFADAVITGRPPAVTGEEGLETLKIIEGIYRKK